MINVCMLRKDFSYKLLITEKFTSSSIYKTSIIAMSLTYRYLLKLKKIRFYILVLFIYSKITSSKLDVLLLEYIKQTYQWTK